MTERPPETYPAPDTPAAVEAAIQRVLRDIDRGVDIVHDAHLRSLSASRAYDEAYAKAYLGASGPAHEKRFVAALAVTEERQEKDVTEAAYAYCRARALALRDRLDGIRSQGASVREAYRSSSAL